MKDDRGFRFLIGCFILFSAFWLYRNGWFAAFEDRDQVESLDVVGLAIQSIISAIDGVGYVAILLVSGAWPAIAKALESVTGLLKPKQPEKMDEAELKELMRKLWEEQQQK